MAVSTLATPSAPHRGAARRPAIAQHDQKNGYRDYDASAATRLEFIRSAQAIGLSLGEIRGVLDFRDRGNVPCTHVAELIDRRAREVSAQIAALERVQADLERLARRARRLSPRDCEKASVCHIIES